MVIRTKTFNYLTKINSFSTVGSTSCIYFCQIFEDFCPSLPGAWGRLRLKFLASRL